MKIATHILPIFLLAGIAPSVTSECVAQSVNVNSRHRTPQKLDSATRAEGIITVSYVDLQRLPRLIKDYHPVYPIEAKRAGLEGQVVIDGWIDTDGMVRKIFVASVSDSIFLRPAIDVVSLMRFTPAISYGRPKPVWWTIWIPFRLADTATAPNLEHEHYATIEVETLYGGQPPVPLSDDESRELTAQLVSQFESEKAILVDSFARYVRYPEAALHDGREGSVKLRVAIDSMGRVSDAHVQSATDSIFIAPALAAIVHARYASPKYYGHSPFGWEYETVNFTLEHALDPAYDDNAHRSGFNDAKGLVSEPSPMFDLQSLIEYPDDAKSIGLQGVVMVSALIDEHGIVRRSSVESTSNPILNTAAQNAVEHMLFHPALDANGPVKTWWTVPVVFRLKSGSR